eukprot:6467304-Amphidinium_carterae.1
MRASTQRAMVHPTFHRISPLESNSSSNTCRIFTDGSLKDSVAGWAWVCIPPTVAVDSLHAAFVPRCWGQVLLHEHALSWGVNSVNSFTAELIGLAEALLWILHSPYTAVQVISDSEAALLSISSSTDPGVESILVQRIRLVLKLVRRKCVITFAHCKSHQGSYPNELADELANLGRTEWASTYRLAQHVRSGKLM